MSKEFTADLLINVLLHEPDLPLFFGLFITISAGDDETIKEINDPEYKRQRVYFSAIKDNCIKLKNDIRFSKAGRKWHKIMYFGIFDDEDNLLLMKQLEDIWSINPGEYISILKNEFNLLIGSNFY